MPCIRDSFTIEFSEGGVDNNLVIEAWSDKKTTPELKPGECYDFVINIKLPATPVDIGDYFVMWADEVTITQNLFNRLVAFWISK